MSAIVAFLFGVLCGVVAYTVSAYVPFLAEWSGLIGLIIFAISAYGWYTRHPR